MFRVAIAISNRADFHASAPSGLHIRSRISDKKAVVWLRSQSLQGSQQDIGRGLVRKSIRTLHMIEIRQQPELLQHGARSGCAFGGRGAFASAEPAQSFIDARILLRARMLSRRIDGSIFLNQRIQLLPVVMRQNLGKAIVQVIADKTLQEIEWKGFGEVLRQNLPDSAANIFGTIQQGSVQVEQIYRKIGYGAVKQAPAVPLRRDPANGDRRCSRGESPAEYDRRYPEA